jgi:hypothetical protein
MGTHMYCESTTYPTTEYASSYRGWNNLKKYIVNIFTNYLFEWIHTYDDCIEELYQKEYKIELFNLLKEYDLYTLKKELSDICINELISIFKKYKNALSCFGFFGIYALINKEDNFGYYSVGNSFDIYELYNLLENYVNEEYLELFNSSKLLFKHSITNNEPICIA